MNETENLLKQIDPALGIDIPDVDSTTGQAIRNAALAHRRSHPALGRGLVAALVALVVLSTASAAAYFLLTDSPSSTSVTCYSQADLTTGASVGIKTDSDFDASACARFWQDGTFAEDGRVPVLTACVNAGGGIAVLPGADDVCASLGLALATDVPSLDPVALLTQELTELNSNSRCIPFDEFVTSVLRLVAESGLAEQGWIVEETTLPTSDRPCGSFGFATNMTVIEVTPIPNIWD